MSPPSRQRLWLPHRRLQHLAGQVRCTQQFECAIVVEAARLVPEMCLDERVSSCRGAQRRRVALSSVLLCSGILRRRSPTKRFSFVACRLSFVSCRVCRAYRHALISPGQEPRGDGVPECLSDCGLTQVSPAWRGMPGRTG